MNDGERELAVFQSALMIETDIHEYGGGRQAVIDAVMADLPEFGQRLAALSEREWIKVTRYAAKTSIAAAQQSAA